MSAAPEPRAPRHLALIPDGNRRWARARGLEPSDGHREGIANVGRIVEAAWAQGVSCVTFWWGSPANLTKRSPGEVAAIVAALNDWLLGPGAELLRRGRASFEAHGRWQQLCPAIGPGVAAARAASDPQAARRLVLLMAYDGREELLDAARRVGDAGGDPDAFGRALWTGELPPVDLLVRTGGEPHLSAGFLLWRIAEAQLAFPEVHWPAFDADALRAVLATYAATGRRFGA